MRRTPLYLSIAALAASIGGYGALYVSRSHGPFLYAIDDAYIGFPPAKNLVEHGVWGMTRYEFSGASTSLLWPLLLAGIHRVIGLRTFTPLALNIACAVGMIVVVYEGLARYVAGPWLRGFAACVAVAAAAPPILVLLGMEHTLQALLTLIVAFGGVRLVAEPDQAHDRRLLLTVALVSALAIAARYDTGSVVAMVIVVLALSKRWIAAAIVAVSAAIPAVIYAMVATRHGWPLVPIALLEKSRLSEMTLTARGLMTALRGSVDVWSAERGVTALVVLAVVLWVALRRSGPAAREPRLLLLIFVVAAALHVQFGLLGWPGRYQAYLMSLGVAAVAAALPLVGPPRKGRGALVWATATVALFYVAKRVVVMHMLLVNDANIAYLHEYQQALFLRAHPQPSAVMIVDLGTPAFFSDARIVDLGSLGTLDAARVSLAHRLTPDAVRALAAVHDVHTLMDIDLRMVPDEFVHVAEWVSPGLDITFFAVDQRSAERLLTDLRAFEPALPPEMSLRVAVMNVPEFRTVSARRRDRRGLL